MCKSEFQLTKSFTVGCVTVSNITAHNSDMFSNSCYWTKKKQQMAMKSSFYLVFD